jgi:hypothetical protein
LANLSSANSSKKSWYEREWNRPTREEIVERACAKLKRDLREVRRLAAQVDRNPEGHDPEEGHGAKHESPVRDSECAQDSPKEPIP